MGNRIYLDNAATTMMSAEVLNEMMPCFSAVYGNASSVHSFGREACAIVDRARQSMQKAMKFILQAVEVKQTLGQ